MKLVLAFLVLGSAANAAPPSFTRLPTGNGFGFQLFDAREGRALAFLDHPYRFLRASSDRRQNGVERRNLLERLDFGAGPASKVEYVDETNILRARGEGEEQFFFAPFDLEENALIAAVRYGESGPRTGSVHLRFHLGANPVSPSFWDSTLAIVKIPGERLTRVGRATVLRGKGQGAMVYYPLQRGARSLCDGGACRADEVGLTLTGPLGNDRSFAVAIVYVEDPARVHAVVSRLGTWAARRTPTRILADSLKEWASWRKPPPPSISGAERALWRQSEAVLRMAQVREPNIPGTRASHGMILASLAPGGWATGWVRDATYATVALARTGHFREARDSLEFFLNAKPVGLFKSYVGGYDYRISVTRYYGSGEEEADYSNQSTPNVETDGWGLYLWAARQYLESSGDDAWLRKATRKGTVYEALRSGIAGAIESQLEERAVMKPDSSIWEVHQENARHFAFTSLTAARGLCDFAAIARRAGHEADHERFAALATQVRAAFSGYFSGPEGFLLGARERTRATDLDSSVVEAFNLGVLDDFRAPVAAATLGHMENLRLESGGFSRIGGTASYETNEWPFIDLRMAGAFQRAGRTADALPLVDRVTAKAEDNYYLIPEMYDPRARDAYAGSIPMVGYGAGAYELALLERAGERAEESCQ